MPNSCYWTLKETCTYLQYKTETNYIYYNDGVFGHDEIMHRNHVVNFEADHGGVIGMFTHDPEIPALKTLLEIVEQIDK